MNDPGTPIDLFIDRDLLARAQELTDLETADAVVDEALRTLVRLKGQEKARRLRGQLHWEGDLDELRASRFGPP